MDETKQLITDIEALEREHDKPDRPEPVKRAIKAAMGLCAAMIRATREFIDKITGA
jgi:hypothetical protein